jgi:hypothetical protein
MDDEGGVLGNLPRSRPGRRSQKRDAAARAAETAERRSAKAARPSPQTKVARPSPQATARSKRGTPRAEAPARPADGGPDPVGDAVRMAAGIAQAGLHAASGLTREVLRRLPRP